MTINRMIGVLIICALIILYIFISHRKALKGESVLACIVAYILSVAIIYSAILLLLWAILLIISG